jgi:hypothetical protein
MNEDMADETAGGAERRPTATAGVTVIVGPFPRELRAGRAVTRPIAHVEIAFDGHEDKFAAILANKGDVGGLKKIEVFPLIHLDDPPPSGKDPGEGCDATGHAAAAISFGARTRL